MGSIFSAAGHCTVSSVLLVFIVADTVFRDYFIQKDSLWKTVISVSFVFKMFLILSILELIKYFPVISALSCTVTIFP